MTKEKNIRKSEKKNFVGNTSQSQTNSSKRAVQSEKLVSKKVSCSTQTVNTSICNPFVDIEQMIQEIKLQNELKAKKSFRKEIALWIGLYALLISIIVLPIGSILAKLAIVVCFFVFLGFVDITMVTVRTILFLLSFFIVFFVVLSAIIVIALSAFL